MKKYYQCSIYRNNESTDKTFRKFQSVLNYLEKVRFESNDYIFECYELDEEDSSYVEWQFTDSNDYINTHR